MWVLWLKHHEGASISARRSHVNGIGPLGPVANLVYSRELEASERVRGVEHRTLGFLLSLALLSFSLNLNVLAMARANEKLPFLG